MSGVPPIMFSVKIGSKIRHFLKATRQIYKKNLNCFFFSLKNNSCMHLEYLFIFLFSNNYFLSLKLIKNGSRCTT